MEPATVIRVAGAGIRFRRNRRGRRSFKDLFAGCKAGLVFVTAFETRRTMQSFVSHIAWESEVWIAEDPDHMIHFNGERFLGPYPDVMPKP